MKAWTKKDIKVLCQAISTFWLVNRPLGDSLAEHERALAEVRAYLAEHREEVVCAGVAELGGIAAERARQNQETAYHFRSHPEVYGKSTPEMIERFTRFAAENHRDLAWAEKLVARVQAEGLPPEVVAFDPIQRS
jgi:hypothetical protein